MGLLECARRLNLSLNTVKRYARHTEPDRKVRAPGYRPTLVDPYHEHLRTRRAKDPAVPVKQLLREIKEQGYTSSANLLARYITQGRVESDRPALSPRRAAALLLSDPDHLRKNQPQLREKLAAACPQMSALAELVAAFAKLLIPEPSQHSETQRLDQPSSFRRPAVPGLLHHRPRAGPGHRRIRTDHAPPQWPHRWCQWAD